MNTQDKTSLSLKQEVTGAVTTANALKMAFEAFDLYDFRVSDEASELCNNMQKIIKEALSEQEPAQEPRCQYADDVGMSEYKCASKCQYEQPAQEPVACPYPCGWNNLYSIITKKGAYLVRSTIGEDETFTSHQRNEMVQIIEYAKTLCEWGKNTHPKQLKRLSEDEIEHLKEGVVDYDCGLIDIRFAKAIEQALATKNGLELIDGN